MLPPWPGPTVMAAPSASSPVASSTTTSRWWSSRARSRASAALELLRENCRLPVGAVALSGEVFLLVHNAALAGLDTAGFDALLAQIAALADRLERKHGGGDQF